MRTVPSAPTAAEESGLTGGVRSLSTTAAPPTQPTAATVRERTIRCNMDAIERSSLAPYSASARTGFAVVGAVDGASRRNSICT
eukprot:5609341-Pleurochrysis_carterae.AAC.2